MQRKDALIAYEQANERYDVHRSSTLSRYLFLADQIAPEHPYGHHPDNPVLTLVDDHALEVNHSLQQVVDRLDFSRFGAVVVVSRDYEVTPYRALSFGFEDCCERVDGVDSFGNGALVEAVQTDSTLQSDVLFRMEYRSMRETLGRLVDDGHLDPETAREQLRKRVVQYGKDGRSVRFATGQEPGTESSAIAELTSRGR